MPVRPEPPHLDTTRELLDGHPLTTLTTLNRDGHPQSTIVSVQRDGDTVLISTIQRAAEGPQHDARSAGDAARAQPADGRWAEIQGRVEMGM